MKTIFILAWRNLRRNRRRTMITAASIMFAVFFAVLVSSIQKGSWDHMVNSVVQYHFGYAQIHKKGFWEDQTIDEVFPPQEALEQLNGEEIEDGKYVPRIESFSLVSNGQKTKGVMVVGIDPPLEDKLTILSDRIIAGEYLSNDDKAVLLAEGLAEYLNMTIGDTVLMLSAGYHGTNASGKYPVKGIVKFASPDLNKRLLYLPVKEASWFFGTEEQITSLVMNIDGPDILKPTLKKVKNELNLDEFEVMDYEEMMPELIEAKDLDSAGSKIILMVLYLIIGFGIFGTILMMLKEREYELGILKAIGMKSGQMSFMVWLEMLLIGMIGSLAGIILSLPIVGYFTKHPIRFTGESAQAYEKFGVEPVIPASMDPQIFFGQAIVIFIVVTILSFYSIWKVYRLEPIEAMRAH